MNTCKYCNASEEVPMGGVEDDHDKNCPSIKPENLIELWQMGDGSWAATIPALGRWACHANDTTAKKTLRNLRRVKKQIIQELVATGKLPAR